MRISVCMASYNGSSFIQEQITSILNQTEKVDEICIVDDCSKDDTVDIVKGFNAKEINLSCNDVNLGYVKTFEKSIESSTGDIIFLCDQDDIWSTNKVEVMLRAFNKNPDISMVCHDVNVVDQDNKPLSGVNISISPGIHRYFSLFQELFKPRIFGCVCAFRGQLKNTYLPFNRYVYTHDHWLTINSMLNGGCLVINDKLINYRLHPFALTKHKSDPFIEKLINRVYFVFMLSLVLKSKLIGKN